MKHILFSIVFLFILFTELQAQEAVKSQPSSTRVDIHYNKYDDILDIRVIDVPIIYYETDEHYFDPSTSVEYKPWENNYIDIQNIYKFKLIMDDIGDIYQSPIPVIIEEINDGY